MRILPMADATEATIGQIRRLVDGLLPKDREVPLFVLDAGYDPIAIGHGLAATRVQVLCPIRDDRVFYGNPPERPNRPRGTGGRRPRHGRRFKCSEPTTWPEPSARLSTSDPRYGTVKVMAWHGQHPRLIGRGRWSRYDAPPIVKGSVIRNSTKIVLLFEERCLDNKRSFRNDGSGMPHELIIDISTSNCDRQNSQVDTSSPQAYAEESEIVQQKAKFMQPGLEGSSDSLLGMCRKLSAVAAPSGNEDRLTAAVVEHLQAGGLEPVVDRLAQVAVVFGPTGHGPTVMVSAHLDELGLTVRAIDGDGMLRRSHP